MIKGQASSRAYIDQFGAPPFIGDRRIKCSPKTADLFFRDSKTALTKAKRLCRQCPLRAECLEWAVASGIDGVAGGMTVEERNALVRGEPVAPEPARRRPATCIHGHELTDDNTYYPPKRPTEWQCRQCGRDRHNRRTAAQRAARLAAQQEASAA